MPLFDILWLGKNGKVTKFDRLEKADFGQALVSAAIKVRQSPHLLPPDCAGFLVEEVTPADLETALNQYNKRLEISGS